MKYIGYVCMTEAMARLEYKKDFDSEANNVIIRKNELTGATTVYIEMPQETDYDNKYTQSNTQSS